MVKRGRFGGWALVAAGFMVGCGAGCAGPQPNGTLPSLKVESLTSPVTASSLRGVSVGPAGQAWASGSGGTVLSGGGPWVIVPGPEGSEALDFRDVEDLGTRGLWLMAAGPSDGSRIYWRSSATGRWIETWRNPHPEGFLDGIAFATDAPPEDAIDPWGVAIGDPISGKFFVMEWAGGAWSRLPMEGLPDARPGEAAFAASGTGLVVRGSAVLFGTGGAGVARVFRSVDRGRTWTVVDTSLAHPAGTSGVFSLAFDADGKAGVALGGDYENPADASACAAWTDDGGLTWQPAAVPPRGYRSAAAWSQGQIVVVGPTGVDGSHDGGLTYHPISEDGFHAVTPDRRGGFLLAGSDGRIARLVPR